MLRFVSQKSSSEDAKVESEDPDYHKCEDQLEEKQEEEAGEMATTNQIF